MGPPPNPDGAVLHKETKTSLNRYLLGSSAISLCHEVYKKEPQRTGVAELLDS